MIFVENHFDISSFWSVNIDDFIFFVDDFTHRLMPLLHLSQRNYVDRFK